MPAPSSQPQWDSNLTHTTALVAAHKTDGYVANEVPASDELNFWMNLVYQWIKYLAQRDSHVMPLSCAGGVVSNGGAYASGWFNTTGDFFPQSINDALARPIPLEAGAHITQVNAYCTDGISALMKWDMKLWKRTITGGAATQIGTTQTSAGTGALQTLSLTGLNETVAVDTVYIIEMIPHAGSSSFGTDSVSGFQVTYDIPAI